MKLLEKTAQWFRQKRQKRNPEPAATIRPHAQAGVALQAPFHRAHSPQPGAGVKRAKERLEAKRATNPPTPHAMPVTRQIRRATQRKVAKQYRLTVAEQHRRMR